MNYLDKYGITEKDLDDIERNNFDYIYCNLFFYKNKVMDNLDYLLSKGFNNVYGLLCSKLLIALEETEDLKRSIESKDNIIEKLNEDIENFDLIGY